jgi:predicted dehydrogenase
MSEKVLRCGVVGVGRMGQHHARVYSQRPDVELVGICDLDIDRAQEVASQWGGVPVTTLDELMTMGVDAVTIATPTVTHRSLTEPLMSAQVACLIEKPLAPDADEAAMLVDAAQRSEAVLQVGHIVRYDPVMQAIRETGFSKPRFIEMDRISPMTFRSIDVSVVLDMMIHDLDLLHWLIGQEPESIHASAVSVLSEAEDVCNARLVYTTPERESGCVANVTASRLAMKTERKIRLISDEMYISADFVERRGTVVRKTANAEKMADVREMLASGEDLSGVNYLDIIELEELAVGSADALETEIEDFLTNVRLGRRPEIDASAGLAAVRTAERIVESARAAGARMV